MSVRKKIIGVKTMFPGAFFREDSLSPKHGLPHQRQLAQARALENSAAAEDQFQYMHGLTRCIYCILTQQVHANCQKVLQFSIVVQLSFRPSVVPLVAPLPTFYLGAEVAQTDNTQVWKPSIVHIRSITLYVLYIRLPNAKQT